jgi:hypothetical protein
MAGTAGVLAGLSLPPEVGLPVLVPNGRGFSDALAAGARSIAVFAGASETFSRHNIGRGIDQSLADYRPIVAEARAKGLHVRGYVSCALGCPYEGKVPLTRVVDVATRLRDMGCEEISLGDTIGVGTPDAARTMVTAVAAEIGITPVALHFHDTYGQALANVLACLDLGVTTVDSAVAGRPAFPRHLRPGACQRARLPRPRRDDGGFGRRRPWRLPLCAGGKREPGDRGSRLHAGGPRGRNRRRSQAPDGSRKGRLRGPRDQATFADGAGPGGANGGGEYPCMMAV